MTDREPISVVGNFYLNGEEFLLGATEKEAKQTFPKLQILDERTHDSTIHQEAFVKFVNWTDHVPGKWNPFPSYETKEDSSVFDELVAMIKRFRTTPSEFQCWICGHDDFINNGQVFSKWGWNLFLINRGQLKISRSLTGHAYPRDFCGLRLTPKTEAWVHISDYGKLPRLDSFQNNLFNKAILASYSPHAY